MRTPKGESAEFFIQVPEGESGGDTGERAWAIVKCEFPVSIFEFRFSDFDFPVSSFQFLEES
jgi:hypothetical protein